MLKIQLKNSEQAKPLTDLIRSLIAADRRFIAGSLEVKSGISEIEQRFPSSDIYLVEGSSAGKESYTGVLIALRHTIAQEDPRILTEAQALLSEEPFQFKSIEAATEIWPHDTLEDRVIDVTLFALAGYQVPETALLVRDPK